MSASVVPLAMRIPPPLMFVAAFFVGVGLQRFIPVTMQSRELLQVGHVVGLALIASGALLALTCAGLFLAARTTIIPFGTASNLITRGPYRITRNPMYVSLTLVYVGVACVLALLWPLVLLPVPIAIVNGVVIPFEEAGLRKAFGEAYREYCASVRRWL